MRMWIDGGDGDGRWEVRRMMGMTKMNDKVVELGMIKFRIGNYF